MNPFAAIPDDLDEDLRRRLLYVAGDGEVMTDRIRRASPVRLLEIAEVFGLKRRRV
jgi:hypothetical protein